eukprot:767083-Hanusia_phi.AAC.4
MLHRRRGQEDLADATAVERGAGELERAQMLRNLAHSCQRLRVSAAPTPQGCSKVKDPTPAHGITLILSAALTDFARAIQRGRQHVNAVLGAPYVLQGHE